MSYGRKVMAECKRWIVGGDGSPEVLSRRRSIGSRIRGIRAGNCVVRATVTDRSDRRIPLYDRELNQITTRAVSPCLADTDETKVSLVRGREEPQIPQLRITIR